MEEEEEEDPKSLGTNLTLDVYFVPRNVTCRFPGNEALKHLDRR